MLPNVDLRIPPSLDTEWGDMDALAGSHFDGVYVGRALHTLSHTRSVSRGEPRCTGLKTLRNRVGAAQWGSENPWPVAYSRFGAAQPYRLA